MHRGSIVGLLIAISAGVFACTPEPARAAPSPAGVSPLDQAAVQAFLDRTLPAQLARLHIPGAAVSVVSAGRHLLSAGYGSGDLTTRRPVDPRRTAMEMGSVAKVLTHTSGFETFSVGIAAEAPAPANGPGAWLAEHQPRRVRPPGLLPAYDSYGVALAGHLVELASGETFATYVDRHILRPL